MPFAVPPSTATSDQSEPSPAVGLNCRWTSSGVRTLLTVSNFLSLAFEFGRGGFPPLGTS